MHSAALPIPMRPTTHGEVVPVPQPAGAEGKQPQPQQPRACCSHLSMASTLLLSPSTGQNEQREQAPETGAYSRGRGWSRCRWYHNRSCASKQSVENGKRLWGCPCSCTAAFLQAPASVHGSLQPGQAEQSSSACPCPALAKLPPAAAAHAPAPSLSLGGK